MITSFPLYDTLLSKVVVRLGNASFDEPSVRFDQDDELRAAGLANFLWRT